jgi:ferredoxin
MAMAVHKVRLINAELNLDRMIEVSEEEYIWDIADAEGIRLPSGCKQGNCSACVVKVISGDVDQSEQVFLRESEVKAGFAAVCVAYPRSDCVLETHQEQSLCGASLYLKTQGKS